MPTVEEIKVVLRRLNQTTGGNKPALTARLKSASLAEYRALFDIEEDEGVGHTEGIGRDATDERDIGFNRRKPRAKVASSDAYPPLLKGSALKDTMYLSSRGPAMHNFTRQCMVLCKSSDYFDESQNFDPVLGELLQPVLTFVRRFVKLTVLDDGRYSGNITDNFGRLQSSLAQEALQLGKFNSITDPAVVDFFNIFATLSMPTLRRSSLEPSDVRKMIDEDAGEQNAGENIEKESAEVNVSGSSAEQHHLAAAQQHSVVEGLPDNVAVRDAVVRAGPEGITLMDLTAALGIAPADTTTFMQRLQDNSLVAPAGFMIVAVPQDTVMTNTGIADPQPGTAAQEGTGGHAESANAQPHPGIRRELKTIRNAIIARLLDWISIFPKPAQGDWNVDFEPEETAKIKRHVGAYMAEHDLQGKPDRIEEVVSGVLQQDQSTDPFPVPHGFHGAVVRAAAKYVNQKAREREKRKEKSMKQAATIAETGEASASGTGEAGLGGGQVAPASDLLAGMRGTKRGREPEVEEGDDVRAERDGARDDAVGERMEIEG